MAIGMRQRGASKRWTDWRNVPGILAHGFGENDALTVSPFEKTPPHQIGIETSFSISRRQLLTWRRLGKLAGSNV